MGSEEKQEVRVAEYDFVFAALRRDARGRAPAAMFNYRASALSMVSCAAAGNLGVMVALKPEPNPRPASEEAAAGLDRSAVSDFAEIMRPTVRFFLPVRPGERSDIDRVPLNARVVVALFVVQDEEPATTVVRGMAIDQQALDRFIADTTREAAWVGGGSTCFARLVEAVGTLAHATEDRPASSDVWLSATVVAARAAALAEYFVAARAPTIGDGPVISRLGETVRAAVGKNPGEELMLHALAEELGEVGRAVQGLRLPRSHKKFATADDVVGECSDVATVACRIALSAWRCGAERA